MWTSYLRSVRRFIWKEIPKAIVEKSGSMDQGIRNSEQYENSEKTDNNRSLH